MRTDGYLDIIIRNWYYFFVASAITMMFHVRDWFSLLVAITAIVGIKCMSQIKWNAIDGIVLLAMIYGLVSFFFSDYRVELYYYGIKKQWVTMFFYFIARSWLFRGDQFIDNMKWPMIVVIVAGIYLYFFPPSWYLDFRYSNILSEEGSFSYFEQTRMSSFFSHPYFLGYGSCFLIIYIVKRILINNETTKYNYLFMLLAAFTLIFAQMRVAITYTLLFFVFVIMHQIFIAKQKSRFVKFLLVLAPVCLVLIFVIPSIMDEGYMDYIEQRTNGQDRDIVEDRFRQFDYFIRYISLLGVGLGRFGHSAMEYNLPSCADNEYIRLFAEQGYVGVFFVLCPIIYAVINGFMHYKECFFEAFALLFFLFVMLGATPLESSSQHSFLLWFCVGHIINKIESHSSKLQIINSQ